MALSVEIPELREIPCLVNLGRYARHNDLTFCHQNFTEYYRYYGKTPQV